MNTYDLFPVNGVWHLRWKLPGLKRRQRSTGERVRARAAPVAARIFAAAQAEWEGRRPTPTLREVVDLWLEDHRRGFSPHYLRAVATFGKLHLYDLGDLMLWQLTTERVGKARQLHLKGRSPASGDAWLRILTLLVCWAIRQKMLLAKPWDVPMLKPQKRPRVILPPPKVAAWFQAVDRAAGPASHQALAVRLMFGLGLRESEALGARWEWLATYNRTYTPGRTKGKEADALKVPCWLMEILLPLQRPSGWILPGRDGRPHAPGFCHRAMEAANQACGTPGITPHRLRGTLATLLVAKVPLNEAQKRLRHKDPRTTLYYTERNEAAVDRAQEELAREMGLSP